MRTCFRNLASPSTRHPSPVFHVVSPHGSGAVPTVHCQHHLLTHRCIKHAVHTHVVHAAAAAESVEQESVNVVKTHDVVALGNLCVDVVMTVDELPSNDVEARKALLAELTANPPDESHWEVGANGNFMIAAARLGMSVASMAHFGDGLYGQFLQTHLRAEGVNVLQRICDDDPPAHVLPPLHSTAHAFSSTEPSSSSSSSTASCESAADSHHRQPSMLTPASSSSAPALPGNGTTPLAAQHGTAEHDESCSDGNNTAHGGKAPHNGVHGARSVANGAQATSSSAIAVYSSSSNSSRAHHQHRTLVCFVLVDTQQRHTFCSRYDFGPWPLLSHVTSISAASLQLLRASRSVFLNGFVFDELAPQLVHSITHEAHRAGAAVFFDPGPRCRTLLHGVRRHALNAVLDVADVVLMTEEEAEVVTGCSDAVAAAHAILQRDGAHTRWCIIKRGGDGAVLCIKSSQHGIQTIHHPGFKVAVEDTVGCGDSFAAAIVKGYTRACDPTATLALANAVGAATATGRGAGRNVASAAVVRQLLQDSAADANTRIAAANAAALQLLGA